MIKNVLKKVKELIYQNWKWLVAFFVLLIAFTYEFPYYIEAPGGTISISSRLEMESNHETSGSFHMAYVTELKATIPTMVLEKLKGDWDLIPKQEVVQANETDKDTYFRDRLLLEEANQNAVLVAFEKAGKSVSMKEQLVYVTYIDSKATTNLKMGDQIVEANGKIISNKQDLQKVLEEKNVNEVVSFLVNRDGKKKVCEATLFSYEGRKMIGLMLTEKRTFDTTPKISFHFDSSESGPSGGLMMSLAIYNNLNSKDLTTGLKIAGTGTIDIDGTVGAIDGIKYKLKGAEKEKADVFFVPNDRNYLEAIKEKDDNDYEIEVIGVDTFNDAITYLKERMDN